jgi:hypothetical protein
MKQYRTYCSTCDAEVLVSLDPDTKKPDPEQVECVDEGEECAETGCPLTGLSASELAEKLEFLPASETRGTEGQPRDLDQAEELLGEARIASFRRRFQRRDD